MRDLHLRHTLKQLARDASEVLTDLVAAGQEIPYEIGEPGDGFAFCQYQPLTARFVRDNATELRALPSFREAREAMDAAELAGPYLQDAGIAPPSDPGERSTLAVTYFLARLWDGSAEFEIDEDRFAAAIAEIEDCLEPDEGEVEAIVPLLGFAMPGTRLDCNGAAIVRADAVDVPSDAARSERPAGAAWEPTFLITARVALDPGGGLGGAGERVARTFERVVTTLRLYRAGGVGLGPHGWVRVAGDRWRRIATGAGRPRPGGYRLSEEDFVPLAELARTVSVHSRRMERLRRPLLRFEAGLDRRVAIDALNDHLLALRFMLAGEGPAGVGLPMRVAALAREAGYRVEAKTAVEQAIELERELWSGEPSGGGASPAPSELAVEIEELLRTILRRAVQGELGSDLRVAADEILLADGLAFGAGAGEELSITTEWDGVDDPEIAEAADAGAPQEDETARGERAEIDAAEVCEAEDAEHIKVSRTEIAAADTQPFQPTFEEAEAPAGEERRVPAGMLVFSDDRAADEPASDEAGEGEPGGWLDEVEGDATMEFPPPSQHLRELAKPPLDREEVRERVEYLFPRPHTEWTVSGSSPHRAAG